MLLDQSIAIQGIKDSSGDSDNARVYKTHFPKVKVFFGNDAKVLDVLQRQTLEMYTVILAHRTLELLAQDVVQAPTHERHECRAVFQRRLREFSVERRAVHVPQIAIRCVHISDAGQGQFFG
jgi:hypothetical protein